MTINHIDTLKEWWESAAQVAPMRGDLVIEDVTDEYGPDYRIRNWPGDRKEKLSYVRVLEPKPKPAWHDAVAVTATATDDLGDEITAVWVREGDELWRSDEGGMVLREDLRDVTPLIEAKVTDEMRDRVRDYYRIEHQVELPRGDVWLNALLTAALGSEAV